MVDHKSHTAEPLTGRASTGSPGLDDVLAGGFPKDHLYLIEGDPGTGKTTLALQFLMEGVRRGEKCLYVTLSESKAELLGVADSHGWDISAIPIYEMTPQEDEFLPEAQYTVFHPADVELADTTGAVLKRVAEVNPSRVVFDSLSELRMLAREPLRYRRQILGLKRYFADRQCTVILLDDRTAEGNDLQLQSIAHGVIIMQSLEREFGIKRRRLEVRKMRGSRYREGYHDYSIETGGVHVYPRLVASEHLQEFKRVPVQSGIKELDQLLGGGLDTGTSTLLIGPAGCGKSTIATRYAISAAERGDHAALFTFDETAGTLLHRTEQLGMPLKRYLQEGRIHLEQVDPAELSPGAFIVGLRKIVQEGKARVVVIDSLNGFLNAMPGEDFLTLQMHEVLSYMNQQGVTTIMTLAQHGFVGMTMQSPVDVSYLADCVLLFRYFEARGEVRQAISVVKKRSGQHERSIRELIFSNGRISVGPSLRQFEGVLTGVPRFKDSVDETLRGADGQTDD